jgi:hypothetical protein
VAVTGAVVLFDIGEAMSCLGSVVSVRAGQLEQAALEQISGQLDRGRDACTTKDTAAADPHAFDSLLRTEVTEIYMKSGCAQTGQRARCA